jgi:hypothetical protein
MRKTVAVALCCLVFFTSAFACGKERWAIKVLGDNPNITYAGEKTVADLRGVPRPADLRVRTPAEKNAVTVKAFLLGYKLEDDEDIHLVIADPQTHETMIAEIPAPGCGRPSEAQYYANARTLLAQVAGPVPAVGRMKRLARPLPIALRGVVFFDFLHNQTGVAPNGIELHPVLLMATAR